MWQVILDRNSGLETLENLHFIPHSSPSETPHTWELPTPKPALIREKRALIITDNLIAGPVFLSGFKSELKMAAYSTYWEAKPEVARGVARSRSTE